MLRRRRAVQIAAELCELHSHGVKPRQCDDVRVIGDALSPRRTIEAIYEGEKAGREL